MIPLPSWFQMQPPSDLHGPGHIARVMTWAAVLTRGSDWFAPVVWAAACHDLRRMDDYDDPQHGFRAGAWVRDVLPGKLAQPRDDLELIASACDWHVCPDAAAGWDHPVLWLLKDADGLDRVRLFDLDPRYLRHKSTRQWVKHAEALFHRTRDLDEPPRIWEEAGKMGLPVAELREFTDRQGELIKDRGRPPAWKSGRA